MKEEKVKTLPRMECNWFAETMIHAQQFYQRWPQMPDNGLYDQKWHTEPLYFSFQQQQQQQQAALLGAESKPVVSDTSSSCDSSPNSGPDAVFPSTSISSQMDYHNRMNAAAAAACYQPNLFNNFMDYQQPFAWQTASLHKMDKTSSPGGKILPTGPGTNNVRVRTADKYRMVYSDYQRLELEKEFHTSAFINADRKTQLSTGLNLTERQIKIWFQNRRAKDRREKQKVKMM